MVIIEAWNEWGEGGYLEASRERGFAFLDVVREVFARDGMLYAVSPFIEMMEGEVPFTATVRYRTVGDMSCTGGVKSTATTIPEIVKEIAATRITERGETRADDKTSEAAMEDRKKAGYF